MFHQTWFDSLVYRKNSLNSLSSLIIQSRAVCLCARVYVSMHQQLCSLSWREWSALGTVRGIIHPDSSAALYKEKGKKALLSLYLDGLYWASCLRSPPPPLVLLLLEISHQSHVGGQPSSPSQRGESEPDLGDNNRAEETQERWEEDGGRMTEKWWVVREVFFIASPSLLNDYYPQCRRCPLSSPPPSNLEEVPGRLHVIHPTLWGEGWQSTDVPQPPDGSFLVLPAPIYSLYGKTGGKQCCIESVWKYVHIYPYTVLMFVPFYIAYVCSLALSPKQSIFFKSFDLCCPNLLPMTNGALTYCTLSTYLSLVLILLFAWWF